MAEREGVTRYELHLRDGPPPPAAACARLEHARALLAAAGVVGADPARYDGVAFGNLSMRLDGGFVVSATGAGSLDASAPRWTTVVASDPARNRVEAEGPCPPSSESMTHAAVYAADAAISAVVHGHAPELWRAAPKLGLPRTAADVPYGTPAMSAAVGALVSTIGATGLLTMDGHEDGVLAWAATPEDAARIVLDAVAAACPRVI